MISEYFELLSAFSNPVLTAILLGILLIHFLVVFVKKCKDTDDIGYAILRHIIFAVSVFAYVVIANGWDAFFPAVLFIMGPLGAIAIIACAIAIVCGIGYVIFQIVKYIFTEADVTGFMYNLFVAPVVQILCFVSPAYKRKRDDAIEAERRRREEEWEEYCRAHDHY